MANWILPVIISLSLWIAWSHRGDHARNLCYRAADPLLPEPAAPASGSFGSDTAEPNTPAAWKAVADFCDGLVQAPDNSSP